VFHCATVCATVLCSVCATVCYKCVTEVSIQIHACLLSMKKLTARSRGSQIYGATGRVRTIGRREGLGSGNQSRKQSASWRV
jgi:hypothetical protein